MRIAFALYPRFTALDLIGPYNILAYGPNVTTQLVAATMEAVSADVGTLRIPPDATFDDAEQPDVIVVPGGPGWKRITDVSTHVVAEARGPVGTVGHVRLHRGLCSGWCRAVGRSPGDDALGGS